MNVFLEQDLINIGSLPYAFPKEIDERIEAFCVSRNIPVYGLPDIDEMKPIENGFLFDNLKHRNKAFIISRILTKERVICIRPIDFINSSTGELEFALWHECGHIDLDNPKTDKLHNEEYADTFAINRLIEYYDGETAKHIYLHWLFNEYKMNPKTGEYIFDDPFRQYAHRKEWLDWYVTDGIEKYQKYFD